MNLRLLSLFLLTLCLMLAAVPALADLYNNGPIDGNTDARTINNGFVVSDSFTTSGGLVSGLSFGAWLFPGDTVMSVEVSITSEEFGGTTFFEETVNLSSSACVTNSLGFDVCTEEGDFNTTLAAGTYWLNLQNAIVPRSGDSVYWDENSGPSLASQSFIGTIPSEAFTILGSTGDTTGTTPESSTIMLFGSGILGCLGVIKRKMDF